MIGIRVSLQHLLSWLVKQSMCDEGIMGMSCMRMESGKGESLSVKKTPWIRISLCIWIRFWMVSEDLRLCWYGWCRKTFQHIPTTIWMVLELFWHHSYQHKIFWFREGCWKTFWHHPNGISDASPDADSCCFMIHESLSSPALCFCVERCWHLSYITDVWTSCSTTCS